MDDEPFGTLDLDSLHGRTLDEARAAVESVGGILRVVVADQPLTMELRPGRVNVEQRGGVVSRVLGAF